MVGVLPLLRVPRERQCVALRHEPHVQQRERRERKEPRRQHAARQRRRARLHDNGLGMQRAEQEDAQVDEGHETQSADTEHGRVAGTEPRIPHGPPYQQVSHVQEEQEQRGRQPGIPCPPRPPDRLSPNGAGREHDGRKHRTHLRRRRGEPVQPGILEEQIEDPGQAHQDHRRFRPERGGHVQVEDLLSGSLQSLHRRERQRPNVHAGEAHETDQRNPSTSVRQGHSSTVNRNRKLASDTNTMSYAASTLRYPTDSLKGRPPSSRAVTCTAAMSGGTRNGSRITTRSSSANRVRITSALNSVPTATNPSVASAMTPTSGTSTRPTGTSKNRTNSGRPTASTTATNTRFATSLPQYRPVRLSGDTSSPSSAWFSSSSWKARFKVSIAANVNVTHRMVGARSTVGTAVGSRPKLNTVSTSAVNTTAETSAVRVRNSSTRSLRATAHACASRSPIGPSRDRPPVRLRDLRGSSPRPRREVHEPAASLERDVGRELDALVHVVRRQHEHAAGCATTTQLAQERPQLGRRGEIEPGERLVQEQHGRIVDQGLGDRRALRQTPGERPHGLIRPIAHAEAPQHLGGAGRAARGGHPVERRPEEQVLAHRKVFVEVGLVADPADRAPPPGYTHRPRPRPDQARQHLE